MNFQIEHYQEINSTNLYLKEIVRKGNFSEGTVILADFQKSGQGRGANLWFAEKGKNLLFSVLFCPGIAANEHFFITEFISLGICDFLKDKNIPATIKWPNDIYIEDSKLAGILIENSIMGTTIEYSITGIGLNVNQLNFPKEIPHPTSMRKHLGNELNLNVCLKELLSAIRFRYKQLRQHKFEFLHTDYNEALYKRNEQIFYRTQEGDELEGKVLSVDPSGELLVDTLKGECKYLFGEIQWQL